MAQTSPEPMDVDDEPMCGKKKTFNLSVHTEVTVTCGLPEHDPSKRQRHLTSDLVDGVHITYRWFDDA